MIQSSWGIVMVLARTELIFFLEVCRMLCFGLLMKIMVITHQRFNCCRATLTQSQGFFLVTFVNIFDIQQFGRINYKVKNWRIIDAMQGEGILNPAIYMCLHSKYVYSSASQNQILSEQWHLHSPEPEAKWQGKVGCSQ